MSDATDAAERWTAELRAFLALPRSVELLRRGRAGELRPEDRADMRTLVDVLRLARLLRAELLVMASDSEAEALRELLSAPEGRA